MGEELLAIATTPVRLVATGSPDEAAWAAILQPYIGRPWLEVPWLESEFYYYRRVIEAVGLGFDPYKVRGDPEQS